MANLKELMETLEKKATEYAKAYNEHSKKAELRVLKTAVSKAVDAYNLEVSKETYRKWAKEGDPVKTAIRTMFIPGAKSVQFKTDEDEYMTVVIRDLKTYEVNLPMMQATLGAKVFANADWFSRCEKLMFLVSNAINEHFNDSVMFKVSISDAAREFAFPAGVDPLSDDGIVHALQAVFDSILFINDPDNDGSNIIRTRLKQDKRGRYYSTEWDYIRESMTMNAGVAKIQVCNTGKFTSYILHAMHTVMTNGSFDLACDGDFVMPKADAAE